ncbi:Carboxylesterase NlhH [Pigmentiphaga humi]|uniref:Carboxylesterase NlhH n=1 Tax=Pigmentiphaga humi TaxID=2478468 RepID=A0A3P4B0V9_9BURK|nr:alpha/beta hydrolase [Pigmentiphaga humi]VCU69288.1 Carboxylesterase NlhH [Pigmentiphaga humi]
MKFLDYPERPPLRPQAAAYHERVLALASGTQGEEAAYGDDPLQRLLVFAAREPAGETLLVFHGGNWTHGYKEWMALMAPPLNRRGIALVSAGYRLGPVNPHPVGLSDCGLALQWVGRNLSRLGGRPDAIFLGGHSAGAHLAALLAVAPESAGAGALPAIAGCLPVSGIYLFGQDTQAAVPPALFPDGGTEERHAAASPLRAALAGAPPFHISWGSDDLPHIRAQSAHMFQALRTAGVEAETLVMENCDHFAASYATAEPEGGWVGSAERFMRRHRARQHAGKSDEPHS